MSVAGVRIFMPLFLTEHAHNLLGLGRVTDAREQIGVALALLADTGECWAAAEIHRTDGDICLAEGDVAAAEARFEHALEIARAQDAKSWELRAAVSLARLRADAGRCAGARELLGPVLGWFTEGFKTGDYIEAQRLLSELS